MATRFAIFDRLVEQCARDPPPSAAAPADRLQQIIDRAGLERFNRMLIEGRHDDDDRQTGSAQPAHHFEAAHYRHLQIEKDQVRLEFGDLAGGLTSVFGFTNHLHLGKEFEFFPQQLRAIGSSSTIRVEIRRSIVVTSTPLEVKFTALNDERPTSNDRRANSDSRREGSKSMGLGFLHCGTGDFPARSSRKCGDCGNSRGSSCTRRGSAAPAGLHNRGSRGGGETVKFTSGMRVEWLGAAVLPLARP